MEKKFKSPDEVFDLPEPTEADIKAMEEYVKSSDESHAWDMYVAACLKEGVSVKRSAEWADEALKERRKRF